MAREGGTGGRRPPQTNRRADVAQEVLGIMIFGGGPHLPASLAGTTPHLTGGLCTLCFRCGSRLIPAAMESSLKKLPSAPLRHAMSL